MDPKDLAAIGLQQLVKQIDDRAVEYETQEWTGAEIRTLINEFESHAPQFGYALQGVNVGSSVMQKLGGVLPGYPNARMEGNVYVVLPPDFDFDKIELKMKLTA